MAVCPLNEDGTFTEVDIYGEKYSGKELYDVLEHYVRKGYYSLDKEEKKKGLDIFWFIWEKSKFTGIRKTEDDNL